MAKTCYAKLKITCAHAVVVNRELMHVTEDVARAVADCEQAAAQLSELNTPAKML